MNIPFQRVGTEPLALNASEEEAGHELRLEGTLAHHKGGLIRLTAQLSGHLSLVCDRCGAEWVSTINEPVELLLSDRLYEPDDQQPLPWPVVEMPGGRIDAAFLLQSEKEAYRCGYHHCPDCAGDEPVEINEGD